MTESEKATHPVRGEWPQIRLAGDGNVYVTREGSEEFCIPLLIGESLELGGVIVSRVRWRDSWGWSVGEA